MAAQTLPEKVAEAMGGRDSFPCACSFCGWDADGRLECVDRYATDFPPIPYMDLREIRYDDECPAIQFCQGCGEGIDADDVTERMA